MKAPRKAVLLEKVLVELRREQDTLARAAQDAYDGATNAEVKQENKYDTRGLESSYLALGQSKRAAEVGENIGRLQMIARELKTSAKAVAGSLVQVEKEDESQHWYLLLPGIGGIRVNDGDISVQVISLNSPLAAEILNKEAGDEARFQKTTMQILSVD